MRVVFFGTPAFAVPSLQALAAEGAQIVTVVTRPDRPVGRSRSRLIPPPVKAAAAALGLPVLQPERPRGDLFVAQLKRLAPELGVVVAYGHLLPPDVLAVPHRGMINVHASLLPRHRGATPIQAALLAGDRETGVTIMQMDAGLDTGPILHRLATPIGEQETAGALSARLGELGARALVECLVLLQRGDAHPTPQAEHLATAAPRLPPPLDREAARVRWELDAEAVARALRAYDPWPGAWTTFAGTPVKLFGPTPGPQACEGGGGGAAGRAEAGRVIRTAPVLVVGTGDGSVTIAEAQPAGKRRMATGAWCRGAGPRPGDRLV